MRTNLRLDYFILNASFTPTKHKATSAWAELFQEIASEVF
jgi:hypothetical protein